MECHNDVSTFVPVPALAASLTRDGLPADKAHLLPFGGALFSIVIVGWSGSTFLGWLADRPDRPSEGHVPDRVPAWWPG